MKKLMLLLLLMLVGCTSVKEEAKIMGDFVDADNIMVYYRASDKVSSSEDINMVSFRYPIKANLGTNIENTPQDEFYAQVNDLTTRLNKNIFDIMQVSLLETAAEGSFDENNVLMFLKNMDNDGMIYFYSDGNVKEICADGRRSYYHLNDDDRSLLTSMIVEYISQIYALKLDLLDA